MAYVRYDTFFSCTSIAITNDFYRNYGKKKIMRRETETKFKNLKRTFNFDNEF